MRPGRPRPGLAAEASRIVERRQGAGAELLRILQRLGEPQVELSARMPEGPEEESVERTLLHRWSAGDFARVQRVPRTRQLIRQ